MRETAPWSPDLARTICERVAGGEMLYPVLRERGMPTPQSVARWAKERPELGADLAQRGGSAGDRCAGWIHSAV